MVPDPMPRVRLVTRACPSRDPARDIRSLPIESTALVEAPLELGGGEPGSVKVISERPGRLHVRVECATNQLLVVAESYHPGWVAEVDGRRVPVLRTNGDFIGCVVNPRTEDVVFEFRPRSLRYGLTLSCLGMTLLVACAISHVLRARLLRSETDE